MKKLIAAFAILASVSAFAAWNGTIITVGTTGPDKYADGSVVLDGERYALVWSQTEFAGFNADGTLVNKDDAVLAVVPRAKGGCCPEFAFEVSASIVTKGGKISLWLLDTRVYGEDNAVSFAKATSATQVEAVTAAAAANATISVQSQGVQTIAADGTIKADAGAVTIPADAPQPKIAGITMDDQFVYVEVENTAPYIRYDISAGDKPADLKSGAAQANPSGSTSGSITLIAPKSGDSGFFKVNQK